MNPEWNSEKIIKTLNLIFFVDEVRALYRSFKQECPNGIVDEETFKEVYERIFPLGDASRYAHLVFAAIDRYFELDIKLNVWYN